MIVRCESCGSTFRVEGDPSDEFQCPDCPESGTAFVTNNPGLAAADSVLYASGEFKAIKRPRVTPPPNADARSRLAKLREDLENRRAARD